MSTLVIVGTTLTNVLNAERTHDPFEIRQFISGIGHLTFKGGYSLTKINLPEGITGISASAFDSCSRLKEINLPPSLTHINAWAFHKCINLTKINLSSGLTKIGDWAFKNCHNLRQIILPPSLTYIGYEAFDGCNNLTYIIIDSDDVTEIGRITLLLPAYLRERVVSKSYYEQAQHEISAVFAHHKLNPLYPLVKNKNLSLCKDMLMVINDFQREDNLCYQEAKHLAIPKNEAQMNAYQEQLARIVQRGLTQTEAQVRTLTQQRYQSFRRHFPEQTIGPITPQVLNHTQRRYHLFSRKALQHYLTALNGFHQCCDELSKKHADLFSRHEHVATQQSSMLLNTLQQAYIEYMNGSRSLADKDLLAQRITEFKEKCQDALDKARPQLQQHRGFKEILINLALAVGTLGIGLLVHYAVNGRFFVHLPTASEAIVNRTCRALAAINAPELEPGALSERLSS